MTLFRESARDLPVVEHADVVVCGAGPAGVAAAIAAARSGAKTRLLEVHGCLGGVWTAGALTWVIDSGNKGGIMHEITAVLRRHGAHRAKNGGFAYNTEIMKLVLEEMCLDANVAVQLHTRVVAAARDSANRLGIVITESKSGRQAWAGRIFIDTTGDGDLAAQAGCGFNIGHPQTGEVQPMSLVALVAGIHANDVAQFIGGHDLAAKERFVAEIERAGISPSYGLPILFQVRDDLFALIVNHEYGVSALDAAQVTQATMRARGETHTAIDALRALGHPWSDLHVVATGAQIGTREGRRIHGHYTVTEDDLLQGVSHQDAVCRVTFGIDVHSTNREASKTFSQDNRKKTLPYDIPLRALIAKDVDGLLMAGRCISGDFLAHSSYRVTGNAVAMGEAAGVTAALAAKRHGLPQDVPWQEVKLRLH